MLCTAESTKVTQASPPACDEWRRRREHARGIPPRRRHIVVARPDGRRPVSRRARFGGDIATESRPSGRTEPGLRPGAARFPSQGRASRARIPPREIPLWFEHDLLDQLQILQILDRLASAEFADTRLSMICINSFPGVDPCRGWAHLDPDQMATLLDKASAVTAQQLILARAVWAAFRSPDPRDIETFLTQNLQALPYLRAALARHLQEFPSTPNGRGGPARARARL